MAKVYEETFKKTDGSNRKMKFLRLKDVTPEDHATYGIPKVEQKGTRSLPDGYETVWDVENRGFRTFNWNTVVKG